MRPVPIEAPAWLAPFLAEARDAIMELQVPTYPHPVLRVASADLPAAADYEATVVYVTDKSTLATSTGAAWVRADGSAL